MFRGRRNHIDPLSYHVSQIACIYITELLSDYITILSPFVQLRFLRMVIKCLNASPTLLGYLATRVAAVAVFWSFWSKKNTTRRHVHMPSLRYLPSGYLT